MQLSKVQSYCRSAPRDRLLEIRKKLNDGLLSGALAGTNAVECLERVEREIAKRELTALFEEAPHRTTVPE